ncbi:MAG: MucB/RseB C-terminal domain-containing protein [Woeseiaceae bacterium]|nr:MucB/RseB C-terminal domain-containing protein [Woeseiaceae bacterium]
MKRTFPSRSELTMLSAAITLLGLSVNASAQSSPDELLDRMNDVVNTIDFEGTVFRRENGESEALRIVRKIIDGVINERLVSQEGNGLEIIRIGNEVHCILPDKQTVLIEEWANQSTLFSSLPSSEIRYGAQYDVAIIREDRVAGRRAIMLAIRPHDNFRYAHRLWLDEETSFPLKTEIVSQDGELIEQIKFAEIEIGDGISKESLAPSMSLANYSWFTQPEHYASAEVETSWQSSDLPPGFKATSTTTEQMPGAANPVTHIVYSDGLAMVSVFIAEAADAPLAGTSNVGAANTYSVLRDGFQVTAVGEVPAATVQRIATSMQQN